MHQKQLRVIGLTVAFYFFPYTLTAAAPESEFIGPVPTLPEPAAQVSGAYNQGALTDSTALPPHGEGFIHLFEKRERFYGSQGMIDLLTQIAGEMARRYPQGERLQIGDISSRNGGKIRGHASHQNGLDVDLVYYRTQRSEQPETEGSQGFAESFVGPNGKITRNFDLERNWEIIKRFASTGRLARVFVHPAVKKAFCKRAKRLKELQTHAETLSRIRPLQDHDDHFHVRLTCPAASPDCRDQEAPPTKTGCENTRF
jgi:penicillin-insensitive murein endopeptidase